MIIDTGLATGGLVGQVPFVCNYGACYYLQQNGSWKKDPVATGRNWAATGSAVIHDKLVIAGGWISGSVSSILLASPNTRTTTFSKSLPHAKYGACIVPWDVDTFYVIGGSSGGSNTYFFNMKRNTRTNGPSLLKGRKYHSCAEMIVNGESFIIVTGGAGSGISSSTEYLAKSNLGNGWKRGKNITDLLCTDATHTILLLGADFPSGSYVHGYDHSHHDMVASYDKSFLYTIGNAGSLKDIHKYSCSGSITNCKWTKINVQLKYGRRSTVAFTIPEALATKLCN